MDHNSRWIALDATSSADPMTMPSVMPARDPSRPAPRRRRPKAPRGLGRPVVGMGDGLARRCPTAPDGHLEGVDDELGTHVLGDRPAHDAPGEGVKDHGQVGLAVLGRVLGDVHHPQAIGLSGIEGPLDQVVGGLSTEIPTGAPSTAMPAICAWRIKRSTRLREQ